MRVNLKARLSVWRRRVRVVSRLLSIPCHVRKLRLKIIVVRIRVNARSRLNVARRLTVRVKTMVIRFLLFVNLVRYVVCRRIVLAVRILTRATLTAK